MVLATGVTIQLCWVDGEALSYETVEMHTDNWYTLKGLVRGQYGTKAISHNVMNDLFVWMKLSEHHHIVLKMLEKDIP